MNEQPRHYECYYYYHYYYYYYYYCYYFYSTHCRVDRRLWCSCSAVHTNPHISHATNVHAMMMMIMMMMVMVTMMRMMRRQWSGDAACDAVAV